MVKYVDSDKKYYLHEGKLEYLSLSLKGMIFSQKRTVFLWNLLIQTCIFIATQTKLYSYDNDIYVDARKCQNINYAIENIILLKFKFK